VPHRCKEEARRFETRTIVLGFVILAATCSACTSARSASSQGSRDISSPVASPSAAQPLDSVGPDRLSPCAPTNSGLVPLTFLGPKPPAHQPPLLPAGAQAALVCRYAGVGESRHAGALVSSVQIGSQQAAALVSLLDLDLPVDLTQSPPACPTNSGVMFALQFAYAQGRVVAATSSLTGCAMTAVDDRAVWTSSSALRFLGALAGGQVAENLLGPQPAGGG